MKKIFISAIAAISALVMVSCGGAPAPTNIEASVKGNKQYKMTTEKAADVYNLVKMGEIVKEGEGKITVETYDENSLTLNEDGTYYFVAKVKDKVSEDKGTFEIAEDGKISFKPEDGNFFLISKDETVYCNGHSLSVTGKMNGYDLTMNYEVKKEEVVVGAPAATANDANAMTAENAAGTYNATEKFVNGNATPSAPTAVLTLTAEGTYEYKATSADETAKTGTYTIEANGVLTLTPAEGEEAVVVTVAGEKLVCANGALSASAESDGIPYVVNFNMAVETPAPEATTEELDA